MVFGGLREGRLNLGLPVPPGNGTLSQDHSSSWSSGSGAGGLAIVAGAPGEVGQALIGCGGLALVAIFAAVHWIQLSLHNVVLAAAALCWVVSDGRTLDSGLGHL